MEVELPLSKLDPLLEAIKAEATLVVAVLYSSARLCQVKTGVKVEVVLVELIISLLNKFIG